MMEGSSSCIIEDSQMLIGKFSLEGGTYSNDTFIVPESEMSNSLDLNSEESINEVDVIESPQEDIQVTVVKDEPETGTRESAFEAQTLFDLGSGTYAYLHDQPQEGCQVLKMDDGRVAYITVIPAQLVEEQEENEKQEQDEEQEQEQEQDEEQEQEQLRVEEPPKKSKPRFMCGYEGCGRLYTSIHHLKVHERSHTGSRPYACTRAECGKAFSTEYARKAHVRTHTGEKPYSCPHGDCTKGFKTSGDLQKHIRTHTGERPFVCPVEGCTRSFTTSNIRKVHIRTHTGERPYVCKVTNCKKAFASATNYKNHMRIHSGEKPYACTVPECDKRFTEYSSLYKHAMVHTQARPYLCGTCGRGYRQPSTLSVHRRTAHGLNGNDLAASFVLGKLLTRRTLRRAAMLNGADTAPAETAGSDTDTATTRVETDEYLLDGEGSYDQISSEQIFIIEDMPEEFAALQHIQDPDDEELRAALDPLKETEL